eukprot:1503832-Pleurochrysis_carterae.AAC.2
MASGQASCGEVEIHCLRTCEVVENWPNYCAELWDPTLAVADFINTKLATDESLSYLLPLAEMSE